MGGVIHCITDTLTLCGAQCVSFQSTVGILRSPTCRKITDCVRTCVNGDTDFSPPTTDVKIPIILLLPLSEFRGKRFLTQFGEKYKY